MKLFMDGTKLNLHVSEISSWMKGESIVPIHAELSLTNVCNQKCEFCYINWSHGKDLLSKEAALSFVDDAKEIGVKSVLIAGDGEPTLNPHWREVIERFYERKLDVALNTNFVQIKDSDFELLGKSLSWLRISFQSHQADKYAQIHRCPPDHYDRVIDNIKKMVAYKKRTGAPLAIGLQQVLLPDNAMDVLETAQLAKSLGVDYYVLKPYHPHELNTKYDVSSKELVSIYKDELKEAEKISNEQFKAIIRWDFLQEASIERTYKKCLALPFIIQVSSNGNVNSCYPHSDKKENIYGNLNSTRLKNIILSEDFRAKWKHLSEVTDVSKCMPLCRHHNANKYLDVITNQQPEHVNFI